MRSLQEIIFMNMQKSGIDPTTMSTEASNPNSPMFLDYLRDDEQDDETQEDPTQQHKIESNSHISIANLTQQTQSNSSERTFTNETSNNNPIPTNGNSTFRSSMNNSLSNLLSNSSLSSSQISHIQKTYLSQFSNPGIYQANQSDSYSTSMDDNGLNHKTSKNNVTSSKKRRVDYSSIFMDIRQGKNADDVEWIDVEGYPRNTIFRFTEIGLQKHREGLQKLCRDNYKKLKQFNVIPFDDDTAKQKVGYNRRLFQFVDPAPKKIKPASSDSIPFMNFGSPNPSSSPATEHKSVAVPLTPVSSPTPVTNSPAIASQSSLLSDLANCEKLCVLTYGELMTNQATGANPEFWEKIFSNIQVGKKVQILLPDPRSLAYYRRCIQWNSEMISSALFDVITKLEPYIGKYKNLQIRLFQEDSTFSGIFVNNKLRHIMLHLSNVTEKSLEIPVSMGDDTYVSHWKKLWMRASPVSPPKIDQNASIKSDKILSHEWSVLKKIFSTPVPYERVDSSVIVYRNRALFENRNFIHGLQITRKKVDLYGITMGQLFCEEASSGFLDLMKDHIEATQVKFRILLKNPEIGCEDLDKVQWASIGGLNKSLLALYKLRQSASNPLLYDKKVEVRLHNHINYFTYFRFDEEISISHHLGEGHPLEVSLFHQHWKNTEEKGPKVRQPAFAYQDFKKVFKAVWEDSIPVIEPNNHTKILYTKKFITWEKALSASANLKKQDETSKLSHKILNECTENDIKSLREFLDSKKGELESPLLQTLNQMVNSQSNVYSRVV